MQEILNPEEEWNMSPEMVEVVSMYLQTTNVKETAENLGVPAEKVNYYITRPEAKRFIDNIFLEQGYLNRFKIQSILDNIIDAKLQEMEEAEITSSKDIIDILDFAWKIRKDTGKDVSEVKNQTNVQINGGENYNMLLEKLLNVGK